MRYSAHLFLTLLLAVSAPKALAHDPHDNDADHDHQGPEVTIQVEDGKNPWTHLNFVNDPNNFQFLVVTDRTGGHRAGVFPDAVRKINLLQPEFVVSVGDLIEGYTEDPDRLASEWDEFIGFVEQLEMPFFYVPGNHDISNDVMTKVWNDRFGRSYYHFVYGDCLFLCLNSEDPPSTQISQGQRDYIKATLDEHTDVRWTFVFLHKPMWTNPEEQQAQNGWQEVEAMLQADERPHTVFAGHYHNYMKHTRGEGERKYNYFVLATTGGGSQLRGPEYGEFDHVVWITMTEQGPRIANLMLEGIFDENIRTTATAALLSPFSNGTAVAFDPVVIEGREFTKATTTLNLTNPADIPLQFTASWQENDRLQLDAENVDLTIPGNGRRTIEVPVRAAEPIDVDTLGPVLLDWTATYEPADFDEPVTIEGTNRIVIERRYTSEPTDRTIVLDGDLSDWEGIEILECNEPAQITGRGTGSWGGVEDSRFRFGTTFDEQNLYVAVEVFDDGYFHDAKLAPWSQDSIVLYLDGRSDPDRSEGRGVDDFAEFFFLAVAPGDDEQEPVFFRTGDLPEDVRIIGKRTETGHIAEIAIPTKYLDEPQDGSWEAFRLNLIVIDYDGENDGVGLYWRPDWRGSANIRGSGTFYRGERLED